MHRRHETSASEVWIFLSEINVIVENAVIDWQKNMFHNKITRLSEKSYLVHVSILELYYFSCHRSFRIPENLFENILVQCTCAVKRIVGNSIFCYQLRTYYSQMVRRSKMVQKWNILLVTFIIFSNQEYDGAKLSPFRRCLRMTSRIVQKPLTIDRSSFGMWISKSCLTAYHAALYLLYVFTRFLQPHFDNFH